MLGMLNEASPTDRIVRMLLGGRLSAASAQEFAHHVRRDTAHRAHKLGPSGDAEVRRVRIRLGYCTAASAGRR